MEVSEISLTPNKSSYEELKDAAGPDILMYPACDESGSCDNDFAGLVYESLLALESGIQAELIASGTSGSYYMKDRNKVSM